MAVQAVTNVLGEAGFPNYPGPLFLGGCHRLLDDVQHEFWWGFHPAGEPVEMRFIDRFKMFFTTQIKSKTVVLDVVNCRHQVIGRR